jgi:hypothetical protein
MSRHTLAGALAAIAAVHAAAQTRVDLRTQTKSVDFSGATLTKPSQVGAVLPSTCTLGQTFLNTSAQAGQNLYICTATNVWSVQGSNGLANYSSAFTSATTVTIPGSTHQLNTAKIFVEVYNTASPAQLVEPDSVDINPGTYDVVINFATAQSGTVVLSAAGGGGGINLISSVFGRLGTVTAQSGDYTAAQITNAAQTNASNTFTAGTQDFSASAHTLPSKVGTTINKPATCTTGEMYFATDAVAGQNWYYCTASNTWTAQVAGGGLPDPGSNGLVARTGVETTTPRVLTAGSGISVTNGDGGSGNPTISLNTAVGLTNANAQANKPWFCSSTTGTTTYSCSLSAAAPLGVYTTGQCVDLLVDTTNTGAATLNIDGLGAKSIKGGDGVTDPLASQITAGRETRVCYDGSVFRLPTAIGSATINLDGNTQGTFSTLNLVTPVGLNWQLVPNGQTLSITPQIDSSVIPSKVAANAYAAGDKQTFAPSTTTAGLNLSSGTLPSAPALGDLATDPTGNLNWYNGTQWVLGAAADTTLTTGSPLVGNGANHLTTGTVTGSGSFVLSTAPTIGNPLITSFVNSNHDHSNAANGGPIAEPINAQTGSGYTVLSGDQAKLVTLSNSTTQVVNLPSTAPYAGWFVDLANVGSAVWTINGNGNNIDGSSANLSLAPTNGIRIVSNGTAYYTQRGMGSATNNQLIRQVLISFDGSGTALSGTLTRCQTVEFGGAIQKINIVGDLAGSGRFKVLSVPFSSYTGPASASDISNGGELISSGYALQDSTLTGWTTALSAGSVICGQLSSESTATWWAITLQVAAN